MKGRQSAEKRRKELLRLERHRDKADRRKQRKDGGFIDGDPDAPDGMSMNPLAAEGNGSLSPLPGDSPVPMGDRIEGGAEVLRADEAV
jgi:hypothetical protein